MATNTSRSQNAELAEGMSDSSYKKVVTDRGGVIGPETYESRMDLSDAHFGIAEAKLKHLGDGTVHVTPDYRPWPLGPAANSLF